MKMAASERPKVKLECLRLLATLKLDPASTQVIGAFLDTYLKLTAEEFRRYQAGFDELAPEERISTMQLATSWELKGKEDLILRQLNKKLGVAPEGTPGRLETLSSEELDELGVALFDFKTYADLDKWFEGEAN
jgi:hypothetical protein